MTEKPKFDAVALQKELTNVEVVFTWNQLFSLFGVNPLNFNARLHTCICVYAAMHFVMNCLNLEESLKEFDSTIDVTTEIGALFFVLVKLVNYRFQQGGLAELMHLVRPDYCVHRYQDEVQVRLFVDYMIKAKNYFVIAIPISINSTALYYFRRITLEGFALPMRIDSNNITTYLLPYRMNFFYPITSRKAYFSAMLYLVPFMPITSFAIMGDMCFMIALLAHTCGQLSSLSRSVLCRLGNGSNKFRQEMAEAVKQHERLICMAKKIDSSFNLIMLHQVLHLMFFICFLGYSMLMYWKQGNFLQLVTFLVPCLALVILLFAYCYAGQSLIDESLYLSDALYESRWYSLKPEHLKYYVILMCRARTPLSFTGGKFLVYSLNSFLVVMKSSMAYLSVLRTVID